MQKWFLPLVIFSLGLMGLVTLSSVSPDLMRRQVIFFAVSFAVFWFVARFPIKIWEQWSEWLWRGLVIILVGLLLFGRVTRGAAAWIDLGWGLRFQPSQFAILVSSFWLLEKFSVRKILTERQLVELALIIGLPGLLILMQPDFGTGFLYFISLSPLVFWQKIQKKYWQGLVLGSLAIAITGWLFILEPYQKLRITSFLSGGQASQTDEGYNARQALIAVGSGEVFGRGLGHGSQSQLRFLPERQTDFIFASLAEEWGLVGSLIIISLYAVLIGFLLQQANTHLPIKRALLLLVTAVFLLAQSFVNIGMNIGLLPITGITLPLVSYGGSSLLATMTMLGVAQRIILQAKKPSTPRIT